MPGQTDNEKMHTSELRVSTYSPVLEPVQNCELEQHTTVSAASDSWEENMIIMEDHNEAEAVYASTSYLTRRKLWADLTRLQADFIRPWVFVGDFNAVLGAHEKWGKRLPPKISCDDFLLWTNANQLSHLNTIGVQFTWSNGRADNDYVALRLDRAICNSLFALYRHCSDHHPWLVSQELSETQHPTPFRFFKTWTSQEDCERVVKEEWNKQ
ncbi:endonuclease/exonuclease/phosphatase family protein, partial [Trifolium pratense]